MKALLLAGGLGTRLRPITNTVPKCLVEINGRPLLDFWLEKIINSGIKNILINTHWLSNNVEDFVLDSKWSRFIDLAYEDNLLGTGGTLTQNIDYFKNEDALVLHADNFSNFNLNEFKNKHYKRPLYCQITLLSFYTSDPSNCGIIKKDERNIITDFFEKVKNPPGNLANAAVYIFDNQVLSDLKNSKNKIYEITTDIIPDYLGKIYNVSTYNYHRDIGNIESYNQCQKDVQLMEI